MLAHQTFYSTSWEVTDLAVCPSAVDFFFYSSVVFLRSSRILLGLNFTDENGERGESSTLARFHRI